MKKNLLAVMIVSIMCFFITGCGTENNKTTLEEIEVSFNSLQDVKNVTYAEFDTEVKDNMLVITSKSETYPDTNTKVEYTLKDGILTSTINSDNVMQGMMCGWVTEAVSVLQGNEEGEISKTINSEESDSYTIDNEGLEIQLLDSGEIKTMIDINKKIKLIDFTNRYITKEDLSEDVSYIKNGSSQKNIGNLSLATSRSSYYGANKYVIEITEDEKLTENSYKSILEVLEVIFDEEKVRKYFAENYSGITEGDKTFDGFEVDIDNESTNIKVTVFEIDLPSL